MRTKVNNESNICIGYQVPDGDVNLAYIHIDNVSPRDNVNIASNIYETNYKEYIANPDNNFILSSDGIYAFHTADIEITDQFALDLRSSIGNTGSTSSSTYGQSEQINYLPLALYYRTKLKNTIDIRTISDKLSVYETGYMGTSQITTDFTADDYLVYFGNKINIQRKYNIALQEKELYKIILKPTSEGRDYEYDAYIYTNFQGKDNVYYTASYKAYGSNMVMDEIINPEAFFTKMYNTLVGVNKIGVNLRINDSGIKTNFDMTMRHNQLNLFPRIRIVSGSKYDNISIKDSSEIQLNLSTPIRINDGVGTILLNVDNTPISDIIASAQALPSVIENQAEGWEDVVSVTNALLEDTKYGVEYLTNSELYRIIIPSKSLSLDNISRGGRLFQYQIDAMLEMQYGDDNPKTINIGIINVGGAVIGNTIVNINETINKGDDRNVLFDNPNHPIYSKKTDEDYWSLDIASPAEKFNDYDIIVIAGKGELDLINYGQKILDFVSNGGKLLLDNCGNTTEALHIINWGSTGDELITFSSSDVATGTTRWVEDNAYLHSRYEIPIGVDNLMGLEYEISTEVYVGAEILIKTGDEDKWSTIAIWDEDPAIPAMVQRTYGLGTIIATNFGLTCSICSPLTAVSLITSQLGFNIILEAVRNVWTKSPMIIDRVYEIDSLFPVEYDEKGYYKEPVGSVTVAKKLLSSSVKQMMSSYIPIELQNAIGTYKVTPYTMSGIPIVDGSLVMSGESDGSEKLWVYSTVPNNNNIDTTGYEDNWASICYPYENLNPLIDDVNVFYCSITPYSFEWNGTSFIEIAGTTKAYRSSVNGAAPKTIIGLDQLPPIGSGSVWANEDSIYYRIQLGRKVNGVWQDTEVNVNVGWFDTKTGRWIVDTMGRNILKFSDIYPATGDNIYERYNWDLSISVMENNLPLGWTYNPINTRLIGTPEIVDGALHLTLDRNTDGPEYSYTNLYKGGIRKTDYDGYDIALEPNTTYIFSMDIKVENGDPYCLISNGTESIVLNIIDDLDAYTGNWSSVNYEFTTTSSVDANNWTVQPIYIFSYDHDSSQQTECYIKNISLAPKPISKIRDIVVKAYTNEYNIILADRKFAIRETQADDISVAQPDTEDIRDPWHIKIHNGKYRTNYYPNNNRNYIPSKCEYILPEFSKQAYDPYFPYIRETEDSVIHLNKNIVQVNRKYVKAGSLKLYRRTSTGCKVTLEKLTTTDNLTFNSVNLNWVDSPNPIICRQDDNTGYSNLNIDSYLIDYDQGKVVFKTAIMFDVYVSYSYVKIEEIRVKDVDLNNGIVHTYENLDYKDDIFANYIAREDYVEYRGYVDEEGLYHSLNLNPTYNRDLFNNPNIVIYLLPYMVDGQVVNEFTIKHCLSRDYGRLNQPMALKLAEIKLSPTTDVENVVIMDGRQRGGGLKASISDYQIGSIHPVSNHFWDITPWNGIAYQSNGVVVIDLPDEIFYSPTNQHGFSEADIMSYIGKYLALGVYPIINRYKGSLPEWTKEQPILVTPEYVFYSNFMVMKFDNE